MPERVYLIRRHPLVRAASAALDETAPAILLATGPIRGTLRLTTETAFAGTTMSRVRSLLK